LIVVYPDLSYHSNFGEISEKISERLDFICQGTQYTWESNDGAFLFKYWFDGSSYRFDFNIVAVDLKTGKWNREETDSMRKELGRIIEFRPRILVGCPVCRNTHVVTPDGSDRWTPNVCPTCAESRMFCVFVTSKEDVRRFCDWKEFKRPAMYGGLL